MSNFENKDRDVPVGVEMLFESSGIEIADKLSIDYINLSLKNLQSAMFTFDGSERPVIDLENDEHAKALIGLALKVKTRTYWSMIQT